MVKGNCLGAMWEEMLVVNTSEEEAAWERWEAKLVYEIWEANEDAICEAKLVWETPHQSLL